MCVCVRVCYCICYVVVGNDFAGGGDGSKAQCVSHEIHALILLVNIQYKA